MRCAATAARISMLGTEDDVRAEYAVIDHCRSTVARYLERHDRIAARCPTISGAPDGENLMPSRLSAAL
ncbi:MAG: hypothetical protein ACR2JC_18965 [Chloroflexota bacterium]|nr:MAG: hypothetical protein DLM70_05585 [Chloroflexota bacterium]